jgi:hypothetical protein
VEHWISIFFEKIQVYQIENVNLAITFLEIISDLLKIIMQGHEDSGEFLGGFFFGIIFRSYDSTGFGIRT